MNYFLLKLRFNTPLHIGESHSSKSLDTSQMVIYADTIFSALCHMAFEYEGVEGINELYRLARQNQLIISDAMPYQGEHLFLPKPIITSAAKRDSEIKDRKKVKKLNYIPVTMYPSYLSFIQGETDFPIDDAIYTFGENDIQDKVAINPNETLPYSVGLFRFDNETQCGLYILLGYEAEEILHKVKKLLRCVGAGGIGGKVSSGYGKFDIIEEISLKDAIDNQSKMLMEMLHSSASKSYILASLALPQKCEMEKAMEGCSYSLLRRGGFVQSVQYRFPVKKQTQYFFSSGSVFKSKFQGDVYDVSRNAGHPVYRYAKPIFLGVDL